MSSSSRQHALQRQLYAIQQSSCNKHKSTSIVKISKASQIAGSRTFASRINNHDDRPFTYQFTQLHSHCWTRAIELHQCSQTSSMLHTSSSRPALAICTYTVTLVYLRLQRFSCDIYLATLCAHSLDLCIAEWLKDDELINPVEELRLKVATNLLHHQFTDICTLQ